MKNKHHQNQTIKRASLKDRLVFLFTGKINNYALYANEDILAAHMSLITNKQGIYYKRHYQDLKKEEVRAIMNFLGTSRIRTKSDEWNEFTNAFPKHHDERRPDFL